MCCLFAPTARAQETFDAPPPHLGNVEGTVTLDREDVTEPAIDGVPIVAGDRLRTERGRAELLFPDGSVIDLDEYTTIELEGPTLLRMTNGRALLFAAGSNNPASVVQFQIDTPVASAQTDGPGEYRVSIVGGPSASQTEMAVVRGGGALVNDLGTVPLRPGERSVAWDNAAPSRPQVFNSARYDALDQWAMTLRDQRLGSRSQSAQYLPADLRMYGGELDRSGAWDYEAPYGYVWYPTVAPEWRPYYDGYWSAVPTYGWTWIGVDVWSWPTHHYGRWGYTRNRWFWIPDRRWAPAWVSWGGAPGYVSWCPLGFDNRPVFSLSVSVGNSYRGWTVLSRDHFGGRRSVRQFAVAPRSLPANIGFVPQASAPLAVPRAVPRRGVGNGRQVAADRRQFPSVVDRTRDGLTDTAAGRRAVGANSAARQPAPRADRSQTVPRQPQSASAPTPTPQSGDRSSAGGQNRGVTRTRPAEAQTTTPASPNESRGYPARQRYERPSNPQAPAQPIIPVTPQPPERRQYGTAMRRAEPIRPAQPTQPDNPEPRRSRQNGGSIEAGRRAAPPEVSAPPQAPPRQERQARQPVPQRHEQAAQPRQERQNDQERSRGHERLPQSAGSNSQHNRGEDDHHRR
jgi:hypothetical protein